MSSHSSNQGPKLRARLTPSEVAQAALAIVHEPMHVTVEHSTSPYGAPADDMEPELLDYDPVVLVRMASVEEDPYGYTITMGMN